MLTFARRGLRHEHLDFTGVAAFLAGNDELDVVTVPQDNNGTRCTRSQQNVSLAEQKIERTYYTLHAADEMVPGS